MTCDSIWETIHASRDWGGLAHPDLPDVLRRRCKGQIFIDRDQPIDILDVGCGGGAVSMILGHCGFRVHAFDAAPSGVALTRRRMAERGYEADVRVLDATGILAAYGPESMDAVIDSCTIQHNRPEAQREIVRQIAAVLRPGGWVYSRMASAGSWGDGTGTRLGERTWTDIAEGPAHGRGVTTFASRQDMIDLWGWLRMGSYIVQEHRMPDPEWGRLFPAHSPLERQWWLEWVIEGVKPTCKRES